MGRWVSRIGVGDRSVRTRQRHAWRGRCAVVMAAVAGVPSLLVTREANADSVWTGGTGNWSVSGNWTGGLPNQATSRAFIDNGNAINSIVTLDQSFSIQSLTIDAGDQLLYGFGSGLTLNNGGLVVNGTIDMGGGIQNGFGTLSFQGGSNQTISGLGQITFGTTTANNSQIQNNGGTATLTFGSGLLIHGRMAQIRDFGGGIINQGTIAADVSGGEIQFNNGSFTNTGTVQAINGGTLTFNNAWHNAGTIVLNNGTVNLGGTFASADVGTISRTNGVINLTGTLNNAGATLSLNASTGSWNVASGTIVGGTVTTSGAAQLVFGNGTLNGVTLNTGANGVQFAGNGAQISVQNGLTLAGGAVIDLTGGVANGFGNLIFSSSTNAQTLGGVGQISFGANSGNNSQLQNAGGTSVVTFGAGILIHGQNGLIRDFGGGIVNQGTIAADVSGGTLQITNGSFTNTGTLAAMNGGTLTVAPTAWHNSGVIVVNNGTVNLGGSFSTADVGTFSRTNGLVNLTGSLDNAGTTLALDATRGSWVMSSGSIHGGTVTTSGGAQLIFGSGTLDGVTLNTGAGGVHFVGSGGQANVQNGLTLVAGTALDLTGGVANGSGSIVFNSSTNAQTLGGSGQVLFGTNTGNNSQIINSGGTSAVVIGPGILIDGQTGLIRDFGGGFVNQGTIAADVGGGQIQFLNGAFTNTGTVAGVNGGTLNINPATWHNAGVIVVNNGTVDLGGTFSTADVGTMSRTNGLVNLTGTLNNVANTLTLDSSRGAWVMSNGLIQGGTVVTTGIGQLVFGSGTLDGVTLNTGSNGVHFAGNGGQLNVVNGLTLAAGSVLDLTGGALNGFGTIVFNTSTNTQTLGGVGEISFGTNTGNNSQFQNAGGTSAVVIGPGILLHGQTGLIRDFGGGIINQGTILAAVASGNIQFLNGNFTNTGTIGAANAGTLTVSPATWHSTGVIVVNNGTVNLGGTFATADVTNISRTNGLINVTGTMNNATTTLALDDTTGSFVMAGGTIAGGTVTTSGAAQLVFGSGTLSGVTLNTGSNGTHFRGSGDQINVSNGLTLAANTVLDLTGGVVNGNGLIVFNSSTNAQTLGGTGRISFGTNSTTNSQIQNGGGTSAAIFGPGILIDGQTGFIRDFGGGIINQGTISANVSGGQIEFLNGNFTNTGTIAGVNGGILNLTPATWHNGGVIVVNNGTVDLGGAFSTADVGTFSRTNGLVNLTGSLNNAAATLALDSSRGAWVMSSGAIHGGTVVTSGSGQLVFGSGTLDNVTLSTGSNGVTFVGNGGQASIQNNLTLVGGAVLDLSGGIAGGFSTMAFTGGSNGSQVVGGAGQISFGTNTTSTSQLQNNGGTSALVIGPGILIHGQTGFLRDFAGGVTTQGTVAADVPGGQIQFLNGSFTNTGTWQAQNGGILNIVPAAWHNAGAIVANGGTVNLGSTFSTPDLGSVVATNGGVVAITGTLINAGSNVALTPATGSWNLTGSGVIRGGTVTTSGGAQLIVPASTIGILDGVTFDGSLKFGGSSILQMQNGLTLKNNPVIDLSPAAGGNGQASTLQFVGPNPQTLGGSGAVVFTGATVNNGGTALATIGTGVLLHGQGGLINGITGGIRNAGTVHLEGTGTLLNLFNFTNAGTFNIDATDTAAYNNIPAFVQESTGSFIVNGLFQTGSNGVNLAGQVSGSGTITTSVTPVNNITLGGTVSPGNGNGNIGTLHLNGNVAFGAGADYVAEASGSNAADLLAITGNLDLSQANDVLDLPSVVPGGFQYVIATYTGTRIGTFDVVNSGGFFNVTYDDANKRIFLTSVPEPSGAVIVLASLGAMATLRRRRRPYVES